MPTQSPADLLAQYRSTLVRLYESTDAGRWGLSLLEFAEAVHQSVQRSQPNAAETTIEKFIDSLRVRDLAMAAACRIGLEAAWNDFIAEYRAVLYRAARAITRDEVSGCELADSLYADLYGLEVRAGRRRSLLQYFDGRSSLATWLHAVLARRHVDSYRRERRTGSIEDFAAPSPPGAPPEDPPDPHRGRYLELLRAALDAALRALKPRDRLRLAYYYLENLTLKQIGQILNEHESTVSRRLARSRKLVRRQVERALQREQRLSLEQIRLCYDYATQEWPFELTRVLYENRQS